MPILVLPALAASYYSPANASPEPCAITPEVVDVSELPEGSEVPACLEDAAVEHDGIILDIPDAGTGVVQESLFEDGAAMFGVEVNVEGEISYDLRDESGDHATQGSSALPGSSTAGPSECGQGANTTSRQWYSTWTWYVGDGSYPTAESYTNFVGRMQASIRAWKDADNDCGFRDRITRFSDSFAGKTTAESNLVNNGGSYSCGSRNNISTVDAGNIDDGGNPPLAVACMWTENASGFPRTLEADIRFNITDFDFTTSPSSGCSTQYDVKSVGVHEMGHVIGLDHVSESSFPRMTMSTNTARCDNSARSLGQGDLLGAQYLYCLNDTCRQTN